MKDSLKEEFQSIRKIIRHNITHLQSLVLNSAELECVIQDLINSDTNEHTENIRSLMSIQDGILESIESFVYQIKSLLSVYDNMIREVCNECC